MRTAPPIVDEGIRCGDPEPSQDDPLRYNTYSLGPEFEVADATVPAAPPTSGDFHSAFRLENGTLAVVIGDVVGHGEEASAHATVLCRAIEGCLIEGLPPKEALGFVNAAAEMSTEFEGFATAFVGTLDPATGRLTYASGGHEPGIVAKPVVFSAGDRDRKPDTLQELDTTGPPLGVLGGDEVQYEEHTVNIADGGTLLLYTDGITEARRSREILGIERLRTLFQKCLTLAPLRIAHKIIGYARAFTGSKLELRDDAALLVLRRRKKKPGS